MIKDQAVNVIRLEGVVATLRAFVLMRVTEANPQMTHDHVGGVLDLKREILERDAVAGRGLAGDGDG